MTNVLLLNGKYFHEKFFKSAINNNSEELEELRKEINEYYSNIPNFNIKKFSNDLFEYPNFKKEGKFEDLKFNDNLENINSNCNII